MHYLSCKTWQDSPKWCWQVNLTKKNLWFLKFVKMQRFVVFPSYMIIRHLNDFMHFPFFPSFTFNTHYKIIRHSRVLDANWSDLFNTNKIENIKKMIRECIHDIISADAANWFQTIIKDNLAIAFKVFGTFY